MLMVRTGACSKVNEEFLLALGSRNNFFERMFVETTGAPQQQEQEHPPPTETSLTQTRTATNTLPSLAGTTWTVEWATHGHLSRLLVITATFLGHEVECGAMRIEERRIQPSWHIFIDLHWLRVKLECRWLDFRPVPKPKLCLSSDIDAGGYMTHQLNT